MFWVLFGWQEVLHSVPCCSEFSFVLHPRTALVCCSREFSPCSLKMRTLVILCALVQCSVCRVFFLLLAVCSEEVSCCRCSAYNFTPIPTWLSNDHLEWSVHSYYFYTLWLTKFLFTSWPPSNCEGSLCHCFQHANEPPWTGSCERHAGLATAFGTKTLIIYYVAMLISCLVLYNRAVQNTFSSECFLF